MFTLSLSPEMEKKLLERAKSQGQDVTGYVHQLIQKDIEKPLTFDEICAPLRQAIEASGVTDNELETLFRETIAEVRQERRAQQSQTL